MKLTILSLLIASALAAGELYFPPPDDPRWQRIKPADAGWNQAAIDSALDFAGSRRSTAVVILYRGKIMAEQDWDPAKQKVTPRWAFERAKDGQVREDVASAQKSVASMLVGIAQKKGLVDIQRPVSAYLGEGWSKASRDREEKILLRHLITMTSGLKESLEFEAEPGTKWFYNTPAYQKTMRILANVTEKTADQLTRDWLTEPIGMKNSEWRERAQMPGLLGFISTAHDMARFGLLVEAGGVWAGKTIVEDREYIRAATHSSQNLNPAYGYLWWLNGLPVMRATGRAPKLIPSAPDDLFAALGAMGRKIYVVPSLGIVATRTGDNNQLKGESSFDEEFWQRLMRGR